MTVFLRPAIIFKFTYDVSVNSFAKEKEGKSWSNSSCLDGLVSDKLDYFVNFSTHFVSNNTKNYSITMNQMIHMHCIQLYALCTCIHFSWRIY